MAKRRLSVVWARFHAMVAAAAAVACCCCRGGGGFIPLSLSSLRWWLMLTGYKFVGFFELFLGR
jgi:hypothetical protein